MTPLGSLPYAFALGALGFVGSYLYMRRMRELIDRGKSESGLMASASAVVYLISVSPILWVMELCSHGDITYWWLIFGAVPAALLIVMSRRIFK